MIKPLENYWVVVRPDGNALYETVSPALHISISYMPDSDWSKYVKLGYTCQQVTITFKIKEK